MPIVKEQKQNTHSVFLHVILPIAMAVAFGLVIAFVIFPDNGIVTAVKNQAPQQVQQVQQQVSAPNTETTAPATPMAAAPAPSPQPKFMLEVQDSSLGYVNVRDSASTSGLIIAKAMPGEKYEYTAKTAGWYTIMLPSGRQGFISATYVKQLPAAQ